MSEFIRKLDDMIYTGRTLARAGVLSGSRPDLTLRALIGVHRWGPALAGGYIGAAARYPSAAAVIDELGTITFARIDSGSNAIARGLARSGIAEGDRVAIMCRNHRGFVLASLACAKLGAHVIYLNTSFAGPQVSEVVEREGAAGIVYDEEFAAAVSDAGDQRRRFVAWGESEVDPSLDELAHLYPAQPLRPPSALGRAVILTSGTTGAPKGVQRATPSSLGPAAALLAAIPLRAREKTLIAAPLFHSWGLAHFYLSKALGSTLVLRRRFDPDDILSTIAEERVTALIVVPVMLQRLLTLSPEALRGHDTSSLRVIAASGSALPGPLAQRVMDQLGPTLYNLYGSTEVAWASIASPADLRDAPGTAGRPPRGTVVRILGQDSRPVRPGETGRIFVGNELLSEGYTGGGGKAKVGGLMATGDMGRFDASGRLFVLGRDDDMIVSGGENVFPSEVEDFLAAVPGVSDVAVVGVEDEEFGQRLRAYVVVEPGAELSAQGLLEQVRANLARYAVPREILFVDELPRTETGKVRKRDLGR